MWSQKLRTSHSVMAGWEPYSSDGEEPTFHRALSHRPRLIEVRIVAKQLELIAVNANCRADSGGRVQIEARGPRLSHVLRTPMDRAAEAHGANSTNLTWRPKIV